MQTWLPASDLPSGIPPESFGDLFSHYCSTTSDWAVATWDKNQTKVLGWSLYGTSENIMNFLGHWIFTNRLHIFSDEVEVLSELYTKIPVQMRNLIISTEGIGIFIHPSFENEFTMVKMRLIGA